MIEKNDEMLFYSTKNSQTNNLSCSIIHGDFLDFQSPVPFDVIISNPPFYRKEVVQSTNPSYAMARYANHLPFDAFISRVSTNLTPRGELLFCYDAKETDMVFSVLAEKKIKPEWIRFVHPRKDNNATLLLCKARKASKSILHVMKPLIALDQDGHAPEAQIIFKQAATHSIKGHFSCA